MTEPSKKLYRSRDQRMIGGVCGGIGEYFNVDPTLIRLGVVFLSAIYPFFALVYLVLLLVVPNEPTGQMEKNEVKNENVVDVPPDNSSENI